MKTSREVQESISKVCKTLEEARQTVRNLESELYDLKHKEARLILINKLNEMPDGKFEQFKIFTGIREKSNSDDPWANIIVGDSQIGELGLISSTLHYDNKVTIPYPDSIEFEKEFKELLKKYIRKTIE